jgi:hypothetical protein
MKELFELSFAAQNIVPTVLLLFAALYWLVFLVGLIDLGALDLHLDHHLDAHADAHVDVHHDVHAEAGKEVHGAQKNMQAVGQSFGVRFMEFFNLGHVPLMVVFSLFAIFFWAFSVLGNYYLGGDSWALTLAILAAGIVCAALLSKVVTQPFRRFFKKLSEEEVAIQFQGKVAVIELAPEGTMLGQATILIANKNLTLSVRSESGKRIPSGVQVAILEHVAGEDYYLVAPLEVETSSNPVP